MCEADLRAVCDGLVFVVSALVDRVVHNGVFSKAFRSQIFYLEHLFDARVLHVLQNKTCS